MSNVEATHACCGKRTQVGPLRARNREKSAATVEARRRHSSRFALIVLLALDRPPTHPPGGWVASRVGRARALQHHQVPSLHNPAAVRKRRVIGKVCLQRRAAKVPETPHPSLRLESCLTSGPVSLPPWPLYFCVASPQKIPVSERQTHTARSACCAALALLVPKHQPVRCFTCCRKRSPAHAHSYQMLPLTEHCRPG